MRENVLSLQSTLASFSQVNSIRLEMLETPEALDNIVVYPLLFICSCCFVHTHVFYEEDNFFTIVLMVCQFGKVRIKCECNISSLE
jgi:hypothetical protein